MPRVDDNRRTVGNCAHFDAAHGRAAIRDADTVSRFSIPIVVSLVAPPEKTARGAGQPSDNADGALVSRHTGLLIRDVLNKRPFWGGVSSSILAPPQRQLQGVQCKSRHHVTLGRHFAVARTAAVELACAARFQQPTLVPRGAALTATARNRRPDDTPQQRHGVQILPVTNSTDRTYTEPTVKRC